MRRVVLTVLVLGLCASSAFAQATGQISGVVSDNTGGVVPGVTVTAVEAGTGITRDTVTGANGRYQFASMRPTSYEIRAELTGFRTVRQTDVVLQANQNLTLNITLELGDLSETVTVAGETATVDVTGAGGTSTFGLEPSLGVPGDCPQPFDGPDDVTAETTTPTEPAPGDGVKPRFTG